MSNPLMNTMLRTDGMLTAAQARVDTGRRATGPENHSPDPFSRTLEERMGNASRPQETQRAAEQRTERAPERSPERAAERTATRDCERSRCTDRSQRAEERRNSGDAESHPTDAPETNASSSNDTGKTKQSANTAPAQTADTTAAQIAAESPTDPATLAAALPAVPALIAADAKGAPRAEDGVAVDPNGAKSSPSPLGRLIADVFARAQSGDKGAPQTKAADAHAAVDLRATKNDAQSGANFAAQLQQQSVAGGRGSPFAAAPGATQPTLQADTAPIMPHGAAFMPGARTESATLPQFQVHTPAGQHVWAEDVGTRVTWMVGRGETKAELVLTPPHLGKLEVSIQMTGDQTTAHFVAASAAARDALEQALPRLREVLQQAGIQLGQANVSTSSEQQAREQAAGNQGAGGRFGSAGDDAGGAAGMQPVRNFWMQTGSGMVDTFA